MSDVGRYRRVRCGQWLESAFVGLTEGERLVALYAQTGPYTNGLGLYRLSMAAAAEDLGKPADVFKHQFETVVRALRWRWDSNARVLWIPTWLEENAPQSPNVVKSWRASFNEVPDCALKAEAAAAIRTFLKAKAKAFIEAFGEAFLEAFLKAFEEGPRAEHSRPSGIREHIREQDQEQDQEQEKRPSLRERQSAFDRFWATYPEKVGKDATRKAFEKALKQATAEEIQDGLERYVRTKADWKAWCNPATFLNQGRWKDDVDDSHASEPRSPSTWDKVAERLSAALSTHDFVTWLGEARDRGIDDAGALIVEVPTPDHVRWIQKHFSEKVSAAISDVGLPGITFKSEQEQVA